MELGFELAKGAAERMLGVKFPIFMRIVLPGLLATGVLYRPTVWLLGYLPSGDEHWWQRIVAYIVLVLFLGALISTLNSQIYKIYEGRNWPTRLFEWGRQRQQARVNRLSNAAEKAKATSRALYDELWNKLRSYPVNEAGDPKATHPTRLGNLLAAYEEYPNSRYGMDSVFFWTRIWLQMDKEKKADIDSEWSVADGFLTLSALSYGGGILWIGLAIGASFQMGAHLLPLDSAAQVFVAGIGWLILGFLLYRFSLPFHSANGEIFKAIFDVYRAEAWNLTTLKPQEKAIWKATWAYLQYTLLICPNCRVEYNSPASEKCRKCGFGLSEMNRHFEEAGNFPS